MDADEVVIRRASRSDVDLVLGVDDLFAFPPTAEWTQDFLDRGSNLLLLALIDDVPVGMLVAVETSYLGASPDLFVYGIQVREHERHRGIAHMLVDKAVEKGAEAGCRRVWGSLTLPDDLELDPPSSPPEGDPPDPATFVIQIP